MIASWKTNADRPDSWSNRLLKRSRSLIFGYRESLITDIFARRTPDPSFSIAENTHREFHRAYEAAELTQRKRARWRILYGRSLFALRASIQRYEPRVSLDKLCVVKIILDLLKLSMKV